MFVKCNTFFYFFIFSRHHADRRTRNLDACLLYNLGMKEFLPAAELAQLPEGRLSAVRPKGLPVLLLNKDGRVFALENRCAHMGCPLAAGALEGYTLECPCHAWRFDVRDGSFLDAPELRLKTYATKISGGTVFIEAEI